MKLLHSKTASKAGSSLWIPAGRGRLEILAKIEKGGCEAAFLLGMLNKDLWHLRLSTHSGSWLLGKADIQRGS